MIEGPSEAVAIRRAVRSDFVAAPGLLQHVLREGFDHGDERWANGKDQLGLYLDHPRNTLYVAVAEDGTVCGTAAIRRGRPDPSHPDWLAERYGEPGTAELLGVYVTRPYRGHGIARRLVEPARRFAAEGDYRRIYLHAHAIAPGAVEFWEEVAAAPVYDARTGADPLGTVHFELPISQAIERLSPRSSYGDKAAM